MKKATTIITLMVFSSLLTAFVLDVDIAPLGRSMATVPAVHLSVVEAPGAHNFDEAIWMAVGQAVSVEQSLPSHLQNIEMEVRPTEFLTEPLRLSFSRDDLLLLKSGYLSPPAFIREKVKFL